MSEMVDSFQTLSVRALLEQAPQGVVYGIDEKERILDEVAKDLSHICGLVRDPVAGPEVREMIKEAKKLDVDWAEGGRYVDV